MTPASRPVLAFLAGLALGAAALGGAWALVERQSAVPVETTGAARTWICSMHPQIRMNRPGRCPICGMPLVPVEATGKAPDNSPAMRDRLTLGEHSRHMARLATVAIEERQIFHEIRTVGKVELDETRVRHIAARVDGRVEEVFANFPGTPVREGDHLVRIYSPDLLSTQEEFLLSLRRENEVDAAGTVVTTGLAASARQRLRLWGLTNEQLDELARTGTAQTHVTVHAPIGGTVIGKNIREGQYVKQGDSLFNIADLGHVWLILEVYESDLSWVRFGQAVEIRLESEPAFALRGTVGFIEPILNEATRTVRVRVILRNEKANLKPGMYAQALIRVAVLPGGKPGPTGLEGKHACPMHPYVVADAAGRCSVCRMPLELVPPSAGDESLGGTQRVLAVPAEAVLTTGRRWLVYVEDRPGEYRLVEPRLGPRAGDYYPVLSGLARDQRVVVRGGFLLDSQFQITGKPSLFYPEGSGGKAQGHEGHVPRSETPEPNAAKETTPHKEN